jgi:hypothetical protein
MTDKLFFVWHTSGGTNDVMRLVDTLERADIGWCVIDGIAVNHWASAPMETEDVDFVVATSDVARAVSHLEDAGFRSERFNWSINCLEHVIGERTLVAEGGVTYDRTPVINPRTGEDLEPLMRANQDPGAVRIGLYLRDRGHRPRWNRRRRRARDHRNGRQTSTPTSCPIGSTRIWASVTGRSPGPSRPAAGAEKVRAA